jgi:ABC-type nitrate/sulfonate/bicarbonate transport system substrate-binding protein
MSETSLPLLRVIAFPGAPNLPAFAAMELGFFAAEGLEVALTLTGSSVEQAKRTAAGEFDIICTAFDNVVAYSEGQGAAGPGVDPGYVVVSGATQLELSLIVAPEVETFEDLKGRTLALDALATGFAFVLDEMLQNAGVSKADCPYVAVGATPQRWQSVKTGEHAGTLTIEPFTSIAQKAGFRVLQSSSGLFDSYQGGVIATRRSILASQPDKVRAFLAGYLKGLEWTLDPANRDAAEAILQARMPEIQPLALKSVMKSVLSSASGLTPGAAVLPEGMAKVLDLRSRHGGAAAPLTDAARYLDLALFQALGQNAPESRA